MKSTGIIRRVDELGRIVIPIELRNKLKIAEKDPIEIYVDGSSIVLKKLKKLAFSVEVQKCKKYKDKLVCDKCIKSIVKLSETDED